MIRLIKKDLRIFLYDKQGIAVAFALPIIIITLFASIFKNTGPSGQNSIFGLVHSVAGTSVMMLLFSVASIGGSLLDEREDGMLKKLLYTPIPPHHILYAKLIFANIISVFQLIVMFVYAWLVFDLDILNHIPSLILVILGIAYSCSGFGLLVASFAKTRQQVQGLSSIIVLVMSAIGGSMIPVFVMPVFLQKIAVLSVNYWGIHAIYDIFGENAQITDIAFLSKILVLIGIGTLLNLLAHLLFRKNILKIV